MAEHPGGGVGGPPRGGLAAIGPGIVESRGNPEKTESRDAFWPSPAASRRRRADGRPARAAGWGWL